MGSNLDKPVTVKESTDESSDKLSCGASSMQGWRITQEDAHNCILDYDTNTAFFAVYDGHGGQEVALYCSQKLPDYIKSMPQYKEGKIEEALTEGFLGFDGTIATPEVVEVLKELAGTKEAEESEDDEDNVNNLYEEAAMPIEKVIEKYAAKKKDEKLSSKDSSNSSGSSSSDETVGTSVGCSSSSTNRAPEPSCGDGVSSSSENVKKDLNGRATEPDSSDSKEVTTEEAPSSSSSSSLKEPTQNGEVAASTPDSEAQANVSSSSVVENGQVEKGKGKKVIKPVPVESSKRPTRNAQRLAQQLYQAWLEQAQDESEESDEDEDKTFEGSPNNSSDEEGVNTSIEVNSEEEESPEEDDEDDEDDEEEEDEEMSKEDEEFRANINEEPGSDSGCTAVVALIVGNELYVANAGDSRCIVCRSGKPVEMSIDHKPEDEEEEKRIKKAGGRVSGEGRVNNGLNLSRAIGDHAYKQNKELSNREQMITSLPDVKRLTLNPAEDEFIFLACDGIWDCLSNQELIDFVRPRLQDGGEKKLSQICEEMFDQCLAPYVLNGKGCDNMTAVLVTFKNSSLKRGVSPTPEESEAKRAKTEPENEAQSSSTTT